MKYFYVFIILSALVYTEAANNLWTAKEYQITIIELSHENEHETDEEHEVSKFYLSIFKSKNLNHLNSQLLTESIEHIDFLSPHLEIHSPPPEV